MAFADSLDADARRVESGVWNIKLDSLDRNHVDATSIIKVVGSSASPVYSLLCFHLKNKKISSLKVAI